MAMRVFVLTVASVVIDDFLDNPILDVVPLVHGVLQPYIMLVVSERASGRVEGYVTEVVPVVPDNPQSSVHFCLPQTTFSDSLWQTQI